MKRSLLAIAAFPLPLLLPLLLLLTGCPDPSQKTGASPTPGATPDASQSAVAKDPLEGSLFSKEELFAIYRAQMAPKGDAQAKALLEKHRLQDAEGKPNKARHEAFQRALKTFAERDPKAWSEFIESLSAGATAK